MLQTILSSQQAKKAREALGLSQGKVATNLQINRSYLSQFESGKRLFSDEDLNLLRQHYENLGFDFDDSPTISGNGIHVIDGFAIPPLIYDAEADDILTEYAENKVKLQRLSVQKIKSGLFGIDEEDIAEKTREILRLMAKNYSLVEQLHGHETITPCHFTEMKKKRSTASEFLSLEFAKAFGPSDEELVVHEDN